MTTSSLISLGGNLESPRNSKPSDYPAVGPSGPEGEAKGAGQLVSLTTEQEGPQHAQDEGEHTPAKWGKADWKVGTASEGSTSISIPYSVDFETGEHTC
jgi:hypothetical protein